jgi:hypothetical protein
MADQPQFGALAFESLTKGKAAPLFNEKLAEVAQALHDYCMEHGYDFTKKAKAEVTLKVTLVHVESGMFIHRADVNAKLPTCPATAGQLVVVNGKVLAPLAEELTDEDDPRQMTFDRAPDAPPINPGQKRM